MNFEERENEHGHRQAYDEEGHPVCSQCGASGYVNTGEGMACHQCREEFLRECELDHE